MPVQIFLPHVTGSWGGGGAGAGWKLAYMTRGQQILVGLKIYTLCNFLRSWKNMCIFLGLYISKWNFCWDQWIRKLFIQTFFQQCVFFWVGNFDCPVFFLGIIFQAHVFVLILYMNLYHVYCMYPPGPYLVECIAICWLNTLCNYFFWW